jgi:hypothetical protein
MKKLYLTGLLTGILALAVLLYFFNPAENLFPSCPFNTFTGFYCPGCGSQRALHNLLHLNLSGVASNNILVFPALLIILYHALYSIIKPKHTNILYLKSTPRIILIVILLFWILRNIPAYPFSLLAPVQTDNINVII